MQHGFMDFVCLINFFVHIFDQWVNSCNTKMRKCYYLAIGILFLIHGSIRAQGTSLRFEHISITEGLSQSEVNCILQDRKGFMWFGTLDGLNRYDGYLIKVYRQNAVVPNSISSNSIQSIYEDKYGNLWVGTFGGGLNHYNRNKDDFTSYRTNRDSLSINSNVINFITSDSRNHLLIGTQLGLSVTSLTSDANPDLRFSNYLNFEINSILEDNQGYLWLASWNGLYVVRLNSRGQPVVVAHFMHDSGNAYSIISNATVSLYQDRNQNIWVGTMNGLDKLEVSKFNGRDSIRFRHFQHIEGNAGSLPNNIVLAIRQDRFSNLWIGTRGGGVSCFNIPTQKFNNYKAGKSNKFGLDNNSIKCLFEDRTGVLWMGTLGGGVNKVDLLRKKFTKYEISLNNNNSPSSNFIRALYEDRHKLLWVGTLDDGLYTYDRRSGIYSHIQGTSNDFEADKAARPNNRLLYGKNVFSLNEFFGDQLWIGTNGGINILNTKTGLFSYHTMDFSNKDSLVSNSVFTIAADDDETLWIGTWGALHHCIKTTGKHSCRFIRYTNNPGDAHSISSNMVRYIYNDPVNSDMWISTIGGGLDRMMKTTRADSVTFIRYMHSNSDTNSISSNEVTMVLRSSAGVLWVATSDGLNKMVECSDPNQCRFIKYRESDGLAGNRVQSIMEDRTGSLWMGTNKGISKFNPATGEFTNFDETDGLQSNEFSEHTCFKSSSNEMFFGGINGFNSFFPDSIQKNNYKPQLVFTGLYIFNKPVNPGQYVNGRIVLNSDISETKEIRLSYKDYVFTIEFAALHYASSNKNRYAYKMEGLDNKWLYTDAFNRRATYTKLKGGTYYFKVKASNNDGVWEDEPIVLKVVIIPPIWKTWIAFILYVAVLAFILYLIYQDIKTRERLKSEVALEKLDQQKMEELNQLKIQFFTNISHEFRTPLALIISPIETIANSGKLTSQFKESVSLIYKNAKYLLRLINELMDFRKTETGSMLLNAHKRDVVSFVQEIFHSYDELAGKRHITYRFSSYAQSVDLWFDAEMLVKILNNLIYNAFKFTADGGEIIVEIQAGKGTQDTALVNCYLIKDENFPVKECISIKVKDNGIGISGPSIENIFNRYYQVGSSDSTRHIGSGIGLALTKNLVLLHKGEIQVNSERNIGSEFIVRLHTGENHLTESEKNTEVRDANAPEAIDTTSPYPNADDLALVENDCGRIFNPDEHVPVILIVEDNPEMRKYIRKGLEEKFRIIEAENGKAGFEMAVDVIPDLIISDVIMPEMDGIQLCRKLKKDILTSHIPVILLTALASVQDKIDGLETGADDYIEKPFHFKLFEVRIENLIRSRIRLRELFSKEVDIESKDFTLNRRDKDFIEKAIGIVKNRISDPELSVNNLSTDLGMSRMHLHRKITALTGQTPGEFIRTIRLKEGARLIQEGRYNISEIAYQVGFTAPSYFTTCFGKQFGISPKEYGLRNPSL